LRINRIILIV